VYFVSDLAGALEPCGCVKDQLGGLDHAAAWIEAQRAVAPASLLVTAGPTFFMDPILEPDHRAQDVAKAEALAGALRHLGFAGWAPAENDWAGGRDEIGKLVDASGAVRLGANLPADAGAPLLPTRIVTVNALRVALIGVGAAAPADAPSVATRPPGEAVRAASDAARAAGANVVIVLASTGRGEAKRIADAVPDLTAIVVGSASARGDGNSPSPPAERVGNVLIAETSNHLQTVGALDLFVRGDSYAFADAVGLGSAQKRVELTRRIDELHVRIANWERDRTVASADVDARRADLSRLEAERARLDVTPAPAHGSYFRYTVQEVRDTLGQDPAVKAALASYYRQVNDANRVQLAGRLPPPVEPGQAAYVGVALCATCHASEKKFWDQTRHARAYATLSSESKEYNLDCVSCHVTGYGKPGGSTVTHVDPLKDVQCEVCHGPGSLHSAAPKVKALSMPGPDLCVGCHHSPHVEAFDATAKMNLIIGPGHGR
jgi:predicted CXXCH cytochrome family protein